MQQGEIHNFTITDVNNEGEGVVRIGDDRFVLFVPDALPGEEAVCRVVRVKKNYGIAKVLERLNSSSDRTTPLCPHFGRCGGCQLQHMTYDAQLKMKTRTVYDALKRIGGVEEPRVGKCISSPSVWGYRNKASVPVQRDRNEKLSAGFYKPRSHEIIHLRECKVLLPELEKNLLRMITALREIGFTGYDEKGQERFMNFIRHIVLRQGKFSGEAHCGVVGTKKLSQAERKKLENKFNTDFPALSGLIYNINSSPGNFIWGEEFETVSGVSEIEEYLDRYRFSFEISSFFQINSQQTVNLYKKATELAAAGRPAKILELYAGVGSLSVFLASRAEKVTAVESWEPAARYIGRNAARNGMNNIEAYSGKAEAFVNGLKQDDYDTVVLDPPRSGCSPDVTNAILQIAPGRIVYISCNPATLARDIKIMLQDKYLIETAQPFDMFPHTGHVEAVVSLTRRK